jgi:NTP pyrophosphatase (non-canonical NTP hydrolase)
MTPEEERCLRSLLILAVKELGEIAECIVKGEGDRQGHWKNELGDLCGLAILPMLELAGVEYEDACVVGITRMRSKVAASD